jgi:hypothetical protein
MGFRTGRFHERNGGGISFRFAFVFGSNGASGFLCLAGRCCTTRKDRLGCAVSRAVSPSPRSGSPASGAITLRSEAVPRQDLRTVDPTKPAIRKSIAGVLLEKGPQ